MAERSKATVSKIVVGATSPRVQIPLSPPFFLPKNGERSRKASLHAFMPIKALHSKNEVFSSHLHQTPEALLVKTLHFIPLVKRSACAAREVAACRRVDVFLFTALRLNGGKPP